MVGVGGQVRASDFREVTRLGRVDTIRVSLTPRGAARLGSDLADLHELVIEAPLLWSPAARALVWIVLPDDDPVRLEPVDRDEVRGEHARVARRWRGREITLEGAFTLPAIAGRWTELGEARVIEYSSAKWNDREHLTGYRHVFGPGVTLSLLGDVGRGVWACQGGQLRITARGIEG